MPFDGIVTKCTAEELSAQLSGGRIEKIYQPETDEITLAIRIANKNFKLLISANASHPRIHLTDAVKENPSVPPGFCMLLRKHLTAGRILSFESRDYERVIEICIESVSELGDLSAKRLIVEIMGRYSNIILIDSEKRILDSIKHVDSDMSSLRQIMPAGIYEPPPSQNKISPSDLKTTEFLKSIETIAKPIDKLFLDKLKGFSPLLCREICHRGRIAPETPASVINTEEWSMIKKALDGILDEINDCNYSPCVILGENQLLFPLDFHCLSIKQYPQLLSFNTISEALDAFFSARDKAERQRQRKSSLNKLLNNAIERCLKKLAIQQETLRDVSDRERFKLYGELITAYIHSIPKKADSISLENYYSDKGEYIDIPLDSTLTPQGNAQKYYKMYAKAKSAFENTTKQLADSMKELEYLESVLQHLGNCTSLNEIKEIRNELSEQGYVKNKKGRSKNGRSRKHRIAVRTEPALYKSTEGFDIFVGKNNVQNDYLTLKFARSSDLWFHTKSIPGSHVILKKDSRPFTQQSLNEAAILAAWHSKGMMSSNVPVDYTEVKNVSKPSGSKPGMVVYTDHRTLYVTPDKTIIESLHS